MRHAPDIDMIQARLQAFFNSDLYDWIERENPKRDSLWTNFILQSLCEFGHSLDYQVFSSQSRCPNADGPEWLYDQHWRVVSESNPFVRISLVMEIEWGYGAATIKEKIMEDFLKLVQARADIRVMVFQCNDVLAMTDGLISVLEQFEGTQTGDQYFFAGWDWDYTNNRAMVCRSYCA